MNARARRTELLAAFRGRLEAVGGRVSVVRDADEAREAFAAIVRDTGAERVARSDASLAGYVCDGLPARVQCLADPGDREQLLQCDLGVSEAQHGIAETGTLMLVSKSERHRLVSLVPPVHVALLPTGRLLAQLEDALDAAAAPSPRDMAACVTFITGPSRTGDIELVLVVGVHGPRELHVLLIDEEEDEK